MGHLDYFQSNLFANFLILGAQNVQSFAMVAGHPSTQDKKIYVAYDQQKNVDQS